MSRAFAFTHTTRKRARLRQWGLCAHCGGDLSDEVEHAHHVVPNQSGTAGDAAHAWLASSDNCVVLCEPCHERVHENAKFRNGAVAPAAAYAHSHGGPHAAALHQAWVLKLNLLTNSVWR